MKTKLAKPSLDGRLRSDYLDTRPSFVKGRSEAKPCCRKFCIMGTERLGVRWKKSKNGSPSPETRTRTRTGTRTETRTGTSSEAALVRDLALEQEDQTMARAKASLTGIATTFVAKGEHLALLVCRPMEKPRRRLYISKILDVIDET